MDKEEEYVVNHFNLICEPDEHAKIAAAITKQGREILIKLRNKLGIPIAKNEDNTN